MKYTISTVVEADSKDAAFESFMRSVTSGEQSPSFYVSEGDESPQIPRSGYLITSRREDEILKNVFGEKYDSIYDIKQEPSI